MPRGIFRLSIDHDRCQGHARCVALAPVLFGVDESGSGQVCSDAPIPDDLLDKAHLALSNCPEGAIIIAEDEA